MSLFKVTHHIKKLLENIEIADASDASAATILEKLLQQHKEYQFEARDKLQTTVKTALTTLTEVKVQPSTPAVASLNQMMASQYNKSASKRQRPVEFDAPNNEDKPLDANNTISSSDKIEEADLKEQMKATEKAAPNTSGRKKKVTAATPRGDAGTGAINPLQVNAELIFILPYHAQVAELSVTPRFHALPQFHLLCTVDQQWHKFPDHSPYHSTG